ncbi:unnamed protein product (mitochondrion) [Plasmodiophora brassicae]|uniref:CWF21 domain-containing protein n=1 Tax=Plasmodiophora brassicae TaxID=37360 RepID=A0A3P3YLI1_PLABS|nr:unnamed protein product [Plasmodiophora brassicae]
MSYNGVGLSTARGSGTNGYVQRNVSALRRATPSMRVAPDDAAAPPRINARADPSLVKHREERAVAVQCMALRVKMEDAGASEDEIARSVAELRQRLSSGPSSRAIAQKEPELEAVLVEAKNRKMKDALGIRDESDPAPPPKPAFERPAGLPRRPWLDRGDGPLPPKRPRNQERSPPPDGRRDAAEVVAVRTLSTVITQVQRQAVESRT